jgi:O-antigen/teichoic acid export membrane protein
VAARDNPARLRYVVQEMTQLMALAGALVLIVIVIAAEPILRILGGAEFVDAAPILRIQSIALFTIFISAAWSPALIGLGRQGSVAAATGVGLAVALGAGLLLVPVWEADGAAWAAAVADVFVLCVLYRLLRRAGPGRELKLGFVPRLALSAGAAVAAGLAPGLPAIPAAVLAAAVFAGAAFALRIVPVGMGELLPKRSA